MDVSVLDISGSQAEIHINPPFTLDIPVPPENQEDSNQGDAHEEDSGKAQEEDVQVDVVPEDVSSPVGIGPTCFDEIWDPEEPGPDYDQFEPVVAEHCWGTNHQGIEGVERVVFLGDSVTQGTPNLAHPLTVDNSHFYRNLLAEWLAGQFGLDKGNLIDWGLWKSYDYVSGKAVNQESGDFMNCSKWGARTDDLLHGGQQIHDCFPSGGSNKRTLVVFTMGGNDISAITKLGGEASADEVSAGYPASWALAESTSQYLREAMEWLKDPERFPNGSYVLFANPFEFTDATGDVSACTLAGVAGFEEGAKPDEQEKVVVHLLEEFMNITVDTQTDMIWLLEHFCGHGFVATGPNADAQNRCYRGPDTPLYFDETCIHPNDSGHKAIFEMFKALVVE